MKKPKRVYKQKLLLSEGTKLKLKSELLLPSKEICSVSLASVLTENLLWNAIEIVTERF